MAHCGDIKKMAGHHATDFNAQYPGTLFLCNTTTDDESSVDSESSIHYQYNINDEEYGSPIFKSYHKEDSLPVTPSSVDSDKEGDKFIYAVHNVQQEGEEEEKDGEEEDDDDDESTSCSSMETLDIIKEQMENGYFQSLLISSQNDSSNYSSISSQNDSSNYSLISSQNDSSNDSPNYSQKIENKSQDVRNLSNPILSPLPTVISHQISEYNNISDEKHKEKLRNENDNKTVLMYERKYIHQMNTKTGLGRKFDWTLCHLWNKAPSNDEDIQEIRTMIKSKYMMIPKNGTRPILTRKEIPDRLLAFEGRENEVNDHWIFCKEHFENYRILYPPLIIYEFHRLQSCMECIKLNSTKLIHKALVMIVMLKLTNWKEFIYQCSIKNLIEQDAIKHEFEETYIKSDICYLTKDGVLHES